MICITSELVGVKYENFLRYALERSDAFLLVFCDYDSKQSYEKRKKKLREELSGYRIKSRRNPSWPSNEIHTDKYKCFVDIHRMSLEVLPFLLKTEGIYNWMYPTYPEDLCFFKNGKCWFASCAHERFASILLKTEADIEFLKANGISYEESGGDVDEFEDYQV